MGSGSQSGNWHGDQIPGYLFPASTLTDNGVQFRSQEMKNFVKFAGIEHRFTALYYPWEMALLRERID